MLLKALVYTSYAVVIFVLVIHVFNIKCTVNFMLKGGILLSNIPLKHLLVIAHVKIS